MTSSVAATILIPTYNRHRHLARVLRYVQAVGAPYRMLVESVA
ncbi:MAG: hypothetical protein Q8R91_03255 [Candidatus Omnitrophota bacterium]|nr:hypothetical protein [Candidatus Omnitrophota bacterium]